ncbi:hypothetical protein [Mesorhizobium sp. 43Arga]
MRFNLAWRAGSSAGAAMTVSIIGGFAGAIVETIGSSHTVSCSKSFSLDTGSVRSALKAGAPRQGSWSQTPATPLIVADMVKRAGCRMKD